MPTFQTALGNGDDGEALAFNPTDGLLYHLSGRGNPNGDSIFETINPDTLAVTNVPLQGGGFNHEDAGFSEEVAGFTFNPLSGNFLASDIDDNFYSVTTAGAVTFLGSMDHFAKGLAFVGATLYSIDNTFGTGANLRMINPTDGATIGAPIPISLAGFTINNGISIATDPVSGQLFGILRVSAVRPGDRVLVTIDPVTGTATLVGQPGVTIATIAFVGQALGTAAATPEELTAIFEIGFSHADIQTHNIEHRLEDIRNGSNGFKSTLAVTDAREFRGLSKDAGKQVLIGKDGKGVMEQATGPAVPENRWGFFVSGTGEFVDVDGDSNADGYDFRTGGVTFGLDYRVSENFAIGVTGGYAHTNASLVDNGHIDVDRGRAGLYGTWFTDGVYLNGLVEGGYGNYDTRRTALLGDATGWTEGGDFSALFGGGYDIKAGNWIFGPTASLRYALVGLDEFTEDGSLAPLHFDSQSNDSLNSRLGGRLGHQCEIGRAVVRSEVRAEWKREWLDESRSISSSFAQIPGTEFTSYGPRLGCDSAVVGADTSIQWCPAFATYVGYYAEVGRENYAQHGVFGGARMSF